MRDDADGFLHPSSLSPHASALSWDVAPRRDSLGLVDAELRQDARQAPAFVIGPLVGLAQHVDVVRGDFGGNCETGQRLLRTRRGGDLPVAVDQLAPTVTICLAFDVNVRSDRR